MQDRLGTRITIFEKLVIQDWKVECSAEKFSKRAKNNKK